MIKMTRRRVVIVLALISGISGELLAAFSMTRIAGPVAEVGGKLGFPAGGTQTLLDLRWTLFAVVSVAAWTGAVLWTSPNRRDQLRGMPINVVAAALAGVTIGLDHAIHADPDPRWRLAAFVVGVAIAMFSSVMVHVIAKMTVTTTAGATSRRIVRARKPSRRRVRRTLAWAVSMLTAVPLRARFAARRAVPAPATAGGSGGTGPDTETRDDDRRDDDTDDRERSDETDDETDDDRDDRDDAPPSITARQAARDWARQNWRPDLRPADVFHAMQKTPTPIVRQEGKRVIDWAKTQSWTQGSNGQEGTG
jgi:hypothetical protein